MSKKKKEGYFWAGYTDLMTSLFFVMLVLYVLTYFLLQKQKQKIEGDAKKYQEIQQAEKAVKNLEESTYFKYEEDYKRLILTEQVQFKLEDHRIPYSDYKYLENVGNTILELVNTKVGGEDSRYLVIIEGMSSRDRKELERHNYELSYKRAYSLFSFWKSRGIDISKNNTEIIIAGSGTGGVGRDKIQKLNQRFLIQIIPKISTK